MEMIVLWFAVLGLSLAVLVYSSQKFTTAAEGIGVYLKIPSFVIGVTIVAIGTSLPELLSSIMAVLRGSAEIVSGNVVGSNVTNILLIAGLSAVMAKRIKFTHELIHVDLPLFVSSAFFLAITMWDGTFSVFDGVLSLLALAIYLVYTVRTQLVQSDKVIEKDLKGDLQAMKGKTRQIGNIMVIVISTVFLYFSAKYVVGAVVELSTILSIPSEIIATTVVALGTSLPEIAVSIVSVRKGQGELALGNVLGSCIFNSYAVMGIPALMGGIVVPPSILMFSLPVMVMASFMFFFFTQDKEITEWEGWILLLFYIFFVVTVFSWG